MSFDKFALICTYSVITVLSQAKSGLSFFLIFLMYWPLRLSSAPVVTHDWKYGRNGTVLPFAILVLATTTAADRQHLFQKTSSASRWVYCLSGNLLNGNMEICSRVASEQPFRRCIIPYLVIGCIRPAVWLLYLTNIDQGYLSNETLFTIITSDSRQLTPSSSSVPPQTAHLNSTAHRDAHRPLEYTQRRRKTRPKPNH